MQLAVGAVLLSYGAVLLPGRPHAHDAMFPFSAFPDGIHIKLVPPENGCPWLSLRRYSAEFGRHLLVVLFFVAESSDSSSS